MKLKCNTPGCNCGGPLTLHSRCHTSAPTWAVLDGDVLTITCSVCESVITTLKLAKEDA